MTMPYSTYNATFKLLFKERHFLLAYKIKINEVSEPKKEVQFLSIE